MKISLDKIALGITDDEVPLGSHLIHFWHTDSEFERGVRFLELGIDDESQYCVLFGHDEANERVLQTLRKAGRDLDRVIRDGRLVILRRESSAAATLASIDAAFSKAVGKGAIAIRYLGNLGMGQAPLPGRGADEVVERRTWCNYVGRSVSVCDRLYVRHQHSFWTSCTRRRIWNASTCRVPWGVAAETLLHKR